MHRPASVQSGGGGRGPYTRSVLMRGGCLSTNALALTSRGINLSSTGTCGRVPASSMVLTCSIPTARSLEATKKSISEAVRELLQVPLTQPLAMISPPDLGGEARGCKLFGGALRVAPDHIRHLVTLRVHKLAHLAQVTHVVSPDALPILEI